MLKILCLRYAKKHGLPVLENVCLPRLGVAKTILDELAPNAGIHVFFYFIIFFSCFIRSPLQNVLYVSVNSFVGKMAQFVELLSRDQYIGSNPTGMVSSGVLSSWCRGPVWYSKTTFNVTFIQV